MSGRTFKFVRNVLLITTAFISIVGSSLASAATANVGWKGIATGAYHSLAIKTDGTVWAWGRNFSGELGNGLSGGKEQEVYAPEPVKGISDVIAVAGGYKHSLALKKDGTVWAWGNNVNGELGDGTKTIMDYVTDPNNTIKVNHNRLLPQQVKNLTHVSSIATGLFSSYALKEDGTLWYWGNDQLTPKQFAGLTNIAAISVGTDHYMALKKDGTVWTWGANAKGQLGNGKVTDVEIIAGAIQYIENNDVAGPTAIKGLSDVIAISAGEYFSLALKKDGTVWSWGMNAKGQLGDGTLKDHSSPMKIKGIAKVKAIVAGVESSIFLKADGTVWSTGDNSIGQLGIGSEANQSTPVQVKSLAGIDQIAGGKGLHFMAKSAKNVLWSWGLNSNGQLGDQDVNNRNKPAWIKAYDAEIEPKPADQIIQVKIDSNLVEFDQPPVIIKDRTMVPLRKIFEVLGAEVLWDEASKTVTATKGDSIVTLKIGSEIGIVNGKSIPLEAPAVIIQDRTLVPIRFIAESFDAIVTWDSNAMAVDIATKK